ncbi:MAG TPA: TIM barrel protein [Actinomycetota bacterium]|nr:TIM barrel protein [Actinomycetota bacterium]
MSQFRGVEQRSISRRGFLGAAAGVASLAALKTMPGVAWAASDCTAKVKDSQIGIQLFTCTSMYLANTPLLLERLAAIGYQKVEHALGWGTTGSPEAFRQACEDVGITATSGHYGDGLHPYDPDTWKQTLENANIVGQTYVGVASKPSGDNSKAAWMAYAEDISKAAPVAREAGFDQVFHHCHDGEWKPVDDDPKVRPADIMLKYTDPDLFHVQLDIGWAYNGLGSVDAVCKELRRYKGRFRTVHVKDFRAGAPVQPGTGEIGAEGFAKIFGAAKETRQNITEFHVESDSSVVTCYDTAQLGWDLLHDMEYSYNCSKRS